MDIFISCFLLVGTMVINSDSDDSTTAKCNDDQKPRYKYRPQFLDHFEGKKAGDARAEDKSATTPTEYSPAAVEQQLQQQQQQQQQQQDWMNNMELQFQQISAINQYGMQQHQQQQQQQQHLLMAYPLMNEQLIALNNQQNLLRSNVTPQQQQQPTSPAAAVAAAAVAGGAQAPPAYQHQHLHTQSHAYVEGEFEFLKFLTFDDLNQRLSNIDHEMELEIEQLNKKYNAKRQPIVDAMNAKRKRQQNINNNLIKI